MSISVKNIALSVNGTPSNQFNIELDGAKYTLDKFKMTQKLLEPCRLEFVLRKAPEEDINEIQFTTCSSIIGKDVTLSLQTDSMEQEISGFSAGSQNADIEFEGFVVYAKATRKESEYAIKVIAESNDTVMKDSPDFDVFNEKTLADIVKDVTGYVGVDAEVDPKMTDPIFYTVKFNETNYEFLRRLARRYGEWMFNNGKKLHFGKFSEQDSITLAYPSQDLTEYSARLKTFHTLSNFAQLTYNDTQAFCMSKAPDNKLKDSGNKLSDTTYGVSDEKYQHKTAFESESISMERDDDVTKVGDLGDILFKETPKAYREGRRANMLVYEGNTYCSKMKIGAKLSIKDNYLSSGSSQEKSEVQQDEILITEVVHTFNVDQEYSNTFKGITAALDTPPYLNPTIHPVCDHPIKGVVKDTEDPKHWGRVRIRFTVPSARVGDVNDPSKWTPWIHVSQPYSGSKDPQFGTHLIPEKDSQVFVEFVGGNMERPYVAGCNMSALWTPVDEEWYPGDNKVKAIRTASGHTIEIHDTESPDSWGDKGYIRIYDSKLNYYEVLLSTDKKLISLRSSGDIALNAGGNITLKAGGGINASAGGEITADAGSNISESAGGGISASAGSDISQTAGGNVNVEAGADFVTSAGGNMDHAASGNMSVTAGEELVAAASNNMHLVADKDFYCFASGNFNQTVEKNLTISVSDSTSITSLKNTDIKAMDIKIWADNGLKEYSTTHDINATTSIGLTATATIDIKALMVKEN